ncbi:hypothetical protein BDR22DRAFT_499207 [Usnea florida]
MPSTCGELIVRFPSFCLSPCTILYPLSPQLLELYVFLLDASPNTSPCNDPCKQRRLRPMSPHSVTVKLASHWMTSMPNLFYAPLLLPLSFSALICPSALGPFYLSVQFVRNVLGCSSIAEMLSNAPIMFRRKDSAGVLGRGDSVSKEVFMILGWPLDCTRVAAVKAQFLIADLVGLDTLACGCYK